MVGRRGRRMARRRMRRRRRVRRRRVMLVGGLIGYGVYKMSSHDAQRIEEHTGLPPEDLEDADLEQAMDELGIEKQTVSDDDREEGPDSSPAPAGASSGPGDEMDELKKAADLHEQGILSDEEFAAMKKKILGM